MNTIVLDTHNLKLIHEIENKVIQVVLIIYREKNYSLLVETYKHYYSKHLNHNSYHLHTYNSRKTNKTRQFKNISEAKRKTVIT